MADCAAVFGKEAGAAVSIGGRFGLCAGGLIYLISYAARVTKRMVRTEPSAVGVAGDCGGPVAWNAGIRLGVLYAPTGSQRCAGDAVLHPSAGSASLRPARRAPQPPLSRLT